MRSRFGTAKTDWHFSSRLTPGLLASALAIWSFASCLVEIPPLASRSEDSGQAGASGGVSISFTLINTDTRQPFSEHDPVTDGATFDLSDLGTSNLTLRANVTGVGSVVFGLDGNAQFHAENGAPYSLSGNNEDSYFSWKLLNGPHTVTATAYKGPNATGGIAGPPATITFTIVD